MSGSIASRSVINPFTSGRWEMEAKPQNFWGRNHATWFYAMGLGGALFVWSALTGRDLGRLLGMSLAHILSLVIIGIGGLVLLADLGRPLQAWRVYRRPRTSWISVGFIADVVFLVSAGLLAIAELAVGDARPLVWTPWAGDGALRVILIVIAAAAAMVVMAYPGIVMASSPAIPFWNNMLIPAQFIGFAFASAIALDLGSAAWQAIDRTAESSLATAGLVATGAAGLLLLLHVLNGRYGGVAAQASFRRLIAGDLRSVFLGALAVGVVAPLAAFAWVLGPGDSGLPLAASVTVAAAAQIGNWLAKYAVIRAGVYPPFL